MNPKKPDLKDLMNSPQAVSLLKNKQAVEQLMNSGEAQRLIAQLTQNSGSDLNHAAQSALKGDTAQLLGLVQDLMKNPQNAKLMEELNKKIPK